MLLEAIDDTRLLGEELIKPLRFCAAQVEHNLSLCTAPACFMFAMATALAAIPAGIGIVVKWVDLASRIDELAHKGPAITYGFSFIMNQTSRLGDRLVAYLHAKHVSEEYDIPLYFTPFKGAEFFALSQIETLKEDKVHPLYFKKIVHLDPSTDIQRLRDINREESTLYVLPYFSESRMEIGGSKYPIDWQAFKPKVQELLEVLPPYHLIPIPENAFSIALHIRTGGTYDSPDTPTMLPGKLPPRDYYIGELEKLLRSPTFPQDKPLFIHIFTDAVNPQEVHDYLQEEMQRRNLPPATLSFTQHASLKDDVANMSRFQCLIRPDSNLTWSMARTSDVLETEIFPFHFSVNEAWDEIAIDQVIKITPESEEISSTHYTMPVVTRFPLPKAFYQWFHSNM